MIIIVLCGCYIIAQNIPKQLSQHLNTCFENGDRKLKDTSDAGIKKNLSFELSKLTQISHLEDLNAFDELNEWFDFIKEKTLSQETTLTNEINLLNIPSAVG